MNVTFTFLDSEERLYIEPPSFVQAEELELPQSLVPDLIEAFCDSWRQMEDSKGQKVRLRQTKGSVGQEVTLEALEQAEAGKQGGGWEELPRRSLRLRQIRENSGEERDQSLAFVPTESLRKPGTEEGDRGREERREKRERQKVERLQFEKQEGERQVEERQEVDRLRTDNIVKLSREAFAEE